MQSNTTAKTVSSSRPSKVHALQQLVPWWQDIDPIVYAALHDRQRELDWFEKSYDDQAEFLLWLRIDPNFESERKDPRFQALLKKVGV